MPSDGIAIQIGTVLRKATLIARADGSPITTGTVNWYLLALSGANIGKWYKDGASPTWEATAQAHAMSHVADGHWTLTLTTSPFSADNVLFLEYYTESGNLHVPDSRILRSAYAPTSDASGNTYEAKIVYVAAAGSDANDGLTWTNAKASIAGALAVAGAGWTVKIGPGSAWEPPDATTIPHGVTLEGAGLNDTIIKALDSGVKTGAAVRFHASGVLRNLTVDAVSNDGDNEGWPDAVSLDGTGTPGQHVLIEDCIVRANRNTLTGSNACLRWATGGTTHVRVIRCELIAAHGADDESGWAWQGTALAAGTRIRFEDCSLDAFGGLATSASVITRDCTFGGNWAAGDNVAQNLNANAPNLDASVASRGTSTLTQTQVTGGAYSIQSASCVFGDARIANLDARISTAATSVQAVAILAAIPSDATNADAVWNELLSGHTTAGSAGAVLPDTASQSGAGASSCTMTITLTGLVGGTPVADADVWITSNSGGSTVVAGTKQTNSSGQCTFLLDAGVTYYLWAQKDGWQGIAGTSFVAVAD
jgi:hypothetical protein